MEYPKTKKGDHITVKKVIEVVNESKKIDYISVQQYNYGAKMPILVSEGTRLEFDGAFMLTCAFDRPTAKEKKAFKSGVPQFDLVVVNGIIFFLSRFGTLNWMDSPFNIHLYPANRILQLKKPGPTQGYGLHVMLIDSSTGILVHQRLIGLEHDLSTRLYDAIIHQPMIPNYNQQVQLTMAQYTTRNLVALKDDCPVGKVQNGVPESMSQLRPSHDGISGIRKDNYPLPEELRKFNYYYDGEGHMVMAIPESLLPRAIKSGDFDGYECPIPCRYVLAKGYRFHEGYVVCNVPYSMELGVDIDESWYDE